MDVETFIRGRPCLEEVEGYLMGLRIQIEELDDPQYPVIDAEVLGPLEQYKARLMSGKETPYPSRQAREWTYAKGKKPQRKRKRYEQETARRKLPDNTSGRTLHTDKGAAGKDGDVRLRNQRQRGRRLHPKSRGGDVSDHTG